MYTNIDGVWRKGDEYTNIDGVWRKGDEYTNINGVWRKEKKDPLLLYDHGAILNENLTGGFSSGHMDIDTQNKYQRGYAYHKKDHIYCYNYVNENTRHFTLKPMSVKEYSKLCFDIEIVEQIFPAQLVYVELSTSKRTSISELRRGFNQGDSGFKTCKFDLTTLRHKDYSYYLGICLYTFKEAAMPNEIKIYKIYLEY